MKYYASGAVGIHMPVINFQTLVTANGKCTMCTLYIHIQFQSMHKNLYFLCAFGIACFCLPLLIGWCPWICCVQFVLSTVCSLQLKKTASIWFFVFWVGFDESKLRSTCDPDMKCFAIPFSNKKSSTTSTTINRLPRMLKCSSQRDFNWFNHINLLPRLLHHIKRERRKQSKKLDIFEQLVVQFFFQNAAVALVLIAKQLRLLIFVDTFNNRFRIAGACVCCMCYVRWHNYFGHNASQRTKIEPFVTHITAAYFLLKHIWKLYMDLQSVQLIFWWRHLPYFVHFQSKCEITHMPSVVYFYSDFFVSFTSKHDSIVCFDFSKIILSGGYR